MEPPTHTHTCRGITIPKIFFSLSDSMYFTKAQPEPIRAMVMKRRAPFNLGGGAGWGRCDDAVGGPAPPARLPHLCAGDSQVCDIVHDGEAFDGVALAVDEVVVDLERQTDGRAVREKDGWTGTV